MDFDAQAATYESRAGIPPAAAAAISAALLRYLPPGAGHRWLEIGPGTGILGRRLLSGPIRYFGLDRASAMLAEFQKHAEGASNALLIHGDANRAWPVAEDSIDVIFSARALHLLNAGHVLMEILRVARRSGARVIVGRVSRAPDSVRARMRREMRHQLARKGVAGVSGENARDRLLDALAARGAERLPLLEAARWSVVASPRASLDAWMSKPGLAGQDVPEKLKRHVERKLREYMEAQWGDPDQPHESEEWFEISGALLRRTP